jgi:hypothetical protein
MMLQNPENTKQRAKIIAYLQKHNIDFIEV